MYSPHSNAPTQRSHQAAQIVTLTMAFLRLLSLILFAVATASSAANPNTYKNDSPSKQELVNMLRDRLHRLQTGVLQGNVINKKSDADRRLQRAGETLEQVRDYDNRGNTQEGINKIFDTVRRLNNADDEF